MPYVVNIETRQTRGRGMEKVTFRKFGKAHRGLLIPSTRQGEENQKQLYASCSCQGSRNGTLTNGAVIIGKDWQQSNCRN